MSGNVLTRDDTMLGVCEALGEDFGFNPVWLRIGFALALFLSPVGAIAAYAGLGLLVGVSRLIAPNPAAAPAPEEVEAGTAAAETPAAEAEAEPLPIAA